VTEAHKPDLQTLEEHKAPCFLWDIERLRIVWANEAGLQLFGAETLFDLLDRPFDRSEPGAALVRSLKIDLGPHESRREILKFPSAGTTAQLSAHCSLYRLEDGRQGVLTIGEGGNDTGETDIRPIAEAFQALPQPVLIVGTGGAIEHQNTAALDHLEPLEGATLGALFGDAEAAKDFASRVSKAGLVSEVRPLTTSLGARDFRLSARRLGQAQGFVMMLEDVTERRRLERALTRKDSPEFKLASATESSPLARDAEVPLIIRTKLDSLKDAICILRDGELLFANSQALALFQTESMRALRQRPDIAAALGSSQEHVAVTGATGEQLSLAVKRSAVPWHRGKAVQVKLSHHSTDNTISEVPRPAEPQPERVAGAAKAEVPVQNTADLAPAPEPLSWKPDDAELSAILDTASDGIITLDAEGRVRSFSAGAEAIFGQPKAMVLGQAFAGLLTADTQKVFRDYLAALTDSGLAAVFNDGREVSAHVGQGRSLPLFLTISKFHVDAKDSQARPSFCAVVRDITQWKQTEAELRDAKERAEQTSRQKSEFLARISHELRTPLNAILGFSEVMRLERFGKLQNEKYRDYVSDIHASGAHLLSLINDLLDLSKVEAGKLELDFTSVSLPDVTEHAMRLLSERAQQARVSVRRSFPTDLPNVVADLRSMRQVLINLLSNAIKFTDPGGQVMVTARMNKAGELILRVKDTGVGMNEEELKGALEPFRRVISAARPDREGTGLGLPLTKALTEANRANFSISSEPGKGTTVEITYPTTRVLAD
jgi:PAS domain S-box-containing protein